MRIGNYWDESQVAIIDLTTLLKGDKKVTFAAPALAATIVSKSGHIIGVIFVEAVPGSEHFGTYSNPLSSSNVPSNVVKINVFEGTDIKNLSLQRTDIWPIEWFGLAQLPPWTDPAVAAFNHAMGVI